MKSLTQIYRQGMGPSTALNMVPYQACSETAKEIHIKRMKVNHIEVNLYNEYARLKDSAGIATDIEFAFAYSNFKYVINTDKPCPEIFKDKPYVFDITVYETADSPSFRHRIVATSGGSYTISGKSPKERLNFNSFEEVKK
ncbi:MAG: hypothetical protein MJ219_02975 [Mycoplasmoidaceae bacterium]|nr:hypothetical protein [Mycoplasmoidaceae bacterium]